MNCRTSASTHLVRILAACCLALPFTAWPHHSYTEYDQQTTIEIEGTLTAVAWRNPHVRFTVAVPKGAGAPVVWDIESSGINNLNRMGANVGHFKVGEKVKVAGWPSRRGPGRMYVTNLQSRDGHELVLWRFSKLRWSSSGAGYGTGADAKLFATGESSISTSLFRVWASDLDDPAANPVSLRASLEKEALLTPAATRSKAAWNPATSKEEAGCVPKGMPDMMSQPFPMEFVDKGDSIELRLEEYDAVRVIHMKPVTDKGSRPRSAAGHSTGKWDGKTLVVTTTGLTAERYSLTTWMRSTSAQLVERFTPGTDGSRLNYSLQITDPEVYVRPAAGQRSWVWRPGEKVMPFDCMADDK